MDESKDGVLELFSQLWSYVTDKHSQGAYNSVCLAVLLALPLLVLVTSLVVCCHCCCCRHNNNSCCCCCRGDATSSSASQSETRNKKKKKKNGNAEDLWISVKTGPMTPDRVALAMV